MNPSQVKDRAKVITEELDRMEDEVSRGDCSDAVRVGYLQAAMSHLRWMFKEGIVYEGTGDLVTAARNKAGLPHPEGAGADGVATGRSESTAGTSGTERKSKGTRGRVKAKPADGPEAEESEAHVASAPVQEGRDTDTSGS